MKILVTGATGFIGNYVVEELLKQGHKVIASSANPKKSEALSWFNKVTYIPLDLSQLDNSVDYYQYFLQPKKMIHLAWEGLPNYKDDFHINQNLPRHLSFLTNMLENGLKDLTVTGTCFEYGMQEGCLREDMETHPTNPYGLAKDTLRKKLEDLQNDDSKPETSNFKLKWVRLFYMYGKGQSPNSLLSQLDKALEKGEKVFNMSGGQQERDFLVIEEVADYVVKIALQDKVIGVINCCSGLPVTVEQFVRDYLKTKHQNIDLNLGFYPYADYEPMSFWGDNSKLKNIIRND
jgi:nucleoside-diphosphate-sugar epimerase